MSMTAVRLGIQFKMARAAIVRRGEPTSEELKLARHLARDGATPAMIHSAVWPRLTIECVRGRMKKFNIQFNTRRAHAGYATSLQPMRTQRSYRLYRPYHNRAQWLTTRKKQL